MAKLKNNIYALYEGAKYNKHILNATRQITRAINDGRITRNNILSNPILEQYRHLGADDTMSRDLILEVVDARRKALKALHSKKK